MMSKNIQNKVPAGTPILSVDVLTGSYQARIDSLKKQIEQLEETRDGQQKENELIYTRREQLEKELLSISERVLEKSEEYESLLKEHQTIKDTCSAGRGEIKALEIQLRKVNEYIKDAYEKKQEKEELEGRIEVFTDQIADAIRELQEITHKREEARRENTQLRNDNEKMMYLRVQLEKLENIIAQKQKKLDETMKETQAGNKNITQFLRKIQKLLDAKNIKLDIMTEVAKLE